MTLNTNEIVYTADYMNISPANDAQIYGLQGDWIISGLQLTSITSTSAVLTAGKAIIQGRLFELKENTTYTLTAGTTQYLGLGIDLSQSNSDNGDGTIVNNQFTVGSSDTVYGDTLQGDIQAFVGLYQVNTQTSTSTQLIFPYNYTKDLTSGYGDVGFPADTRIEKPAVRRVGKNVQVWGILNNAGTISNGQADLVMRILPEGCRPPAKIYGTFPSAGNTYEISIDTGGNIRITNYTGKAIQAKSFISITFNFMTN